MLIGAVNRLPHVAPMSVRHKSGASGANMIAYPTVVNISWPTHTRRRAGGRGTPPPQLLLERVLSSDQPQKDDQPRFRADSPPVCGYSNRYAWGHRRRAHPGGGTRGGAGRDVAGRAAGPPAARPGQLPRRPGLDDRQRRPLGRPLPVPLRRRQHRYRLGHLEQPPRRVCPLVHAEQRRPPLPARLLLLPTAPVRPRQRRQRGRQGLQQPQQPRHHGRLLRRLQTAARPGPRLRTTRDHPGRAGPLGLPGAEGGLLRPGLLRLGLRGLQRLRGRGGLPQHRPGLRRGPAAPARPVRPHRLAGPPRLLLGGQCRRLQLPVSLADTAAHAAQVASFLNSAGLAGNAPGVSSWDLLFTDTSDRDAAYYQDVYGNPHTWWDPTNATLPDFANFRTYLAGLNAGTGRRIVLWQTPLGNQYFETEDNTDGHYQDNRAQYFLGDGPGYAHLTDFANAGMAGLLFGAGAAGPTTYTDAKGDGITNPAPVVSFQCNQCNTHVAQYSDDDGGYIRLFGGQYLQAGGVPVPLAGSGGPTSTPTAGGPTSTSAPPTNTPAPATSTPVPLSVSITSVSVGSASVAPGSTEALNTTVSATGALSGAIVDFEVYDSGNNKVYQTYQSASFSANTPQTFSASWAVPAGQATGSYRLKIGIFGAGWAPLYAWD